MSEQPRYGAPSPADGPTTPGTSAISRAEVRRVGHRRRPAIRPDGRPRRRSRRHHPRRRRRRTARARRRRPGRTRVGGAWIGLILGAVVLVFLLVFILQNLDPRAWHVPRLARHAAAGDLAALRRDRRGAAARDPGSRADGAVAPRGQRLGTGALVSAVAAPRRGTAAARRPRPRLRLRHHALRHHPPRPRGDVRVGRRRRRGCCAASGSSSSPAATSPTSTTSSTPPPSGRARGSTASPRSASSASTATWPPSGCARRPTSRGPTTTSTASSPSPPRCSSAARPTSATGRCCSAPGRSRRPTIPPTRTRRRARRPGRAPTTRATRWSGGPRRPARRPGPARGATGARAGTRSAPRWR